MKKKQKKRSKSIKKTSKIESQLIENFVLLQKVLSNLSEKFQELSANISSLLELFKTSAKTLSKKEIIFGKPIDEKKILKKLEELSEQNKTIARGITLLYEKPEEEIPEEKQKTPEPKTPPVPAPSKESYKKSPYSGI